MPSGSPQRVPDTRTDRTISLVRRWSHLLDGAFRVPGTGIRFGWDPIVGLVPGLGDLITGLASFLLIAHAFRLPLPRIIRVKMILNVLIEVLIGVIPIVGDIFDFAWKSNLRNLALLEKHAGTGVKAGAADWAFVIGTLAAAVAIIAIPVLLLILLLQQLQIWIDGPQLWNI